jgi:hypothetical protein
MKIINLTKNKVLSDDAILANALFQRIKGLLGRKDFRTGEALIIKPCNSVHTFFMRFPIDILFVDKNNRVIEVIPYLKPFRLTPVYFSASFVIELPAGTLKSSSTQEGDTLLLA